jgi:hypothetical protein
VSTTDFPFPFGGIKFAVHLGPDDAAFQSALAFMASGCGLDHRHNIAVQCDGNVIHTGDLGVACLRRWREGHEMAKSRELSH